ncbi:NADH-ubiquinone dehydrogenase [Kumtagia ephedrae]|uniref:NADH-ubiquinone dehydrogenase n=1 Tax=Kumtagia ephedrae TaxID=2116701 RepID=A0A2P7SQ34_9HYPH|nr:NADH-ubiquinone dehydrogenase [Mesorhizobium ephedrae]PSJ64455.1 NADH-ubiquinone dehydrogenase [Mesorhizobium ephedrae]
MSMFSIPDGLLPSETMLDDAMKQMGVPMPAEMAGAVNLMAHPLAGAAAMSALGVGLASQAMGAWLGSMAGAATASRRLFLPMFEEAAADAHEFRDTARTPQARAKMAASTLIAEAGMLPGKPQAGKVESRAGKAAQSAPKVARIKVAPAEKSGTGAGPKAAGSAPVQPAATGKAAVEATPQAGAAPAAPPSGELRKPAAIGKPARPDDLKAIAGVGPKLEQVLNGLGVWTYAQIAAWSKDEIAWVEDSLGFSGRIDRDDWIGQATKLAGVKT